MATSFDTNTEMSGIEAPIISFENVSKEYQAGIAAVDNVNIRIYKGEFVFIVGKSGSGKTTLLRMLLKEIHPSKGKVFVNGQELGRLNRRRVSKFRRSIGVVFQDFRLLKDRTVYDNVAFAQRVVETPEQLIKRQVPKMLSMVGLSEKGKSFPSELSGGQQQRVALARALVNHPAILLADEPTGALDTNSGNLDQKSSWEIMSLLEDINKRGTTVVVVTHNQEIVDKMQKRVITLREGRVINDENKGRNR